MIKKCTKCGENKDVSEYYKKSAAHDGLCPSCKSCEYIRKRKAYLNRTPEQKELKRVKDLEYSRTYRVKEYYKEKSKKETLRRQTDGDYNIECRERRKKHNVDLDKRAKRKAKYRKTYKYRVAARQMVYDCIRRLGTTKKESTFKSLGYSAIELKEHLESLFTDGMSWDNHGEWHIDHIIPVSSFDKGTPLDVINALSNLQPLWATTREINGVVYEGNLNKNNKY